MTAGHSGRDDLADLEPGIREIFKQSPLSSDPQRLNVFMFALDNKGEVVHEFHGLPGSRRANNPGRSDHQVEIKKARSALNLPALKEDSHTGEKLSGLPDLPAGDGSLPAGVRLFIRQDVAGNTHFSRVPVVEVVPMTAADWKPLAFSPGRREMSAEVLRNWLVWLYPAGIRAADERVRFQQFSGTLGYEPAGADETTRYAMLRGQIHLTKGDDTQSAFEGELKAVLGYAINSPEVKSLRAVVEGAYLYRLERNNRQILRAAIESRPDWRPSD